jgi:hypothetical protein
MQVHTNRTRDAALRRLALANRWLIAASATLTGVLSAVAAQAFPGRTISSTNAHTQKANAHKGQTHKGQSQNQSHHSTDSLKAPQQAPRSTPTHTEPAPERTAEPEQRAAPERVAPEQQAAPSKEAPPAEESQPAPQAAQSEPAQSAPETPAPAQEAPPVVSGGS